MAKFGIFKKVAALAMAVALVLCFAVSAGAVTVTTSTSYLDGNEGDILVEVTVAGEELVGKSVTYYAYDSSNNPVYIDQYEDTTADGAYFEFATDDANLNTGVKVGYTGASDATPSQIDAYTVTWGDQVVYIPNNADVATVKFATTATSVEAISATGATVVDKNIAAGSGYLTVILGDITGNVTLNVTVGAEVVVETIDAAFLISNGSDDHHQLADTAAGDRKLTVVGRVLNADEFGVVLAEKDGIATGEKYRAIATQGDLQGKTSEGYYAIQFIDDSETDKWLDATKSYDVAAYGDNEVAAPKTVTARNQ